MTWALRQGGTACPKSAEFRKESESSATPEAEKGKAQFDILAQVAPDSTREWIAQAFGVAEKKAKSRKLEFKLELYRAVNYSFIVLFNDRDEIIGVASSGEEAIKTPIPIIGNNEDVSDKKNYSLRALNDSGDNRQLKIRGPADARFGYFLTSNVYYGRPGRYYNYYFAFSQWDANSACKAELMNETPLDWSGSKPVAEIKCKEYLDLIPMYTFVDMSGREGLYGERLARAVLRYIYWNELE
jgi:hypothetical protein